MNHVNKYLKSASLENEKWKIYIENNKYFELSKSWFMLNTLFFKTKLECPKDTLLYFSYYINAQ
jgi:hypothetical protein